jgi:hypothetical protein
LQMPNPWSRPTSCPQSTGTAAKRQVTG